ncbi:MAG: hypothetical protein JNK48_14395 [Bryobacterales bacterium]|nr:hypothetical protein [Bryobacterales bacterium]
MPAHVRFTIGGVVVDAEFDGTAAARALLDAMPYTAIGNYWGREFYFKMPVSLKEDETAREVVQPGTVAFWVEGSCLCLFWGATPVSRSNECRAASAVNVIGRVLNPEVLETLKGRDVTVEALPTGEPE